MKREPVSAEEMARLLASWRVYTHEIERQCRDGKYRLVSTKRFRGVAYLQRRAQRLLLHWWRLGIEREAKRQAWDEGYDDAFQDLNHPRSPQRQNPYGKDDG